MRTFAFHRVLANAAGCAAALLLACTGDDSGKGSTPVGIGDARTDATTEASDVAPVDGADANACRCWPDEIDDCRTLDGSVFPYECDCPRFDPLPADCFRLGGVTTAWDRIIFCCKEPPAP